MSSIAIASIAFGCIFGGAVVGFIIQSFLPEHHLSAPSKDAVKLGAGLIATMAALILGLLVASSKGSFDAVNNGLMQMGSKIIILDRDLANYGPEANDARLALKKSVAQGISAIWPEEEKTPISSVGIKALENSTAMENVSRMVNQLDPKTDAQRKLQSHAMQICSELLQGRWLLIEQQQGTVPPLLLIVALFWLAMLNVTFGLFAPRNATVIAVLFACALSVSGAIFLLEEMDTPLDGSIKVSSGPLREAYQDIGK